MTICRSSVAIGLQVVAALGLSAAAGAQAPEHAGGGPPETALSALTVAAGYVAPEASLADDGEILASATEGGIEERSLSAFDVIHVDPSFDGRRAAVGDSLLLYLDAGELRHPTTGASLGRVVHPTGMAIVTSLEGEVASGVIVWGFDAVVAGQRVQYLKPRGEALPAGERLGGEGVVVGLRERGATVVPYSIIYLDLPRGGGLAAGEDVRLGRPAFEEGRELPEIEIGKARVLDAGATAATAIVLDLDRSDLRVGDRYRPVPSER